MTWPNIKQVEPEFVGALATLGVQESHIMPSRQESFAYVPPECATGHIANMPNIIQWSFGSATG
jgi:hypothetical protein